MPMNSVESDRIFVVRKMVRAEVEIAKDWSAKEGWNPGN
jgi:hypothetical protein